MKKFINAEFLLPGQRIVLDMGFSGPMEERCLVLSAEKGTSLFRDPVIKIKVRRPGGAEVHVVGHRYTDKVEVVG